MAGGVELVERALQAHAEGGLDLDNLAGGQELVETLECLYVIATSRRRDAGGRPGTHHLVHVLAGNFPHRLIERSEHTLKARRSLLDRRRAEPPRHP